MNTFQQNPQQTTALSTIILNLAKTLSNEKITIDYSKWVNNINVVKKFTDKINDYNKMLFDED